MNDDLLDSQKFVTNAIASMGVLMERRDEYSNPQLDWFDGVANCRKRMDARDSISPDTARIFLELFEQKLVPSWVLKHIDIDFIKMAV